ncbi:MAG: hypothetical protein AB1352_02225 [Patescibacteria group bacterium]
MNYLKKYWYLVVIVVIGAGVMITATTRHKPRYPQQAQPPVAENPQATDIPATTIVSESGVIPTNATVVFKENTGDKTMTAVYLKDNIDGREIYFATLPNIRKSYHPAEYHNGHIYILLRTGGDSGYETDPDWTDELWRYDVYGKREKIFSARGLDFRVSDDESLIAVKANENYFILNSNGVTLKSFQKNEIVISSENYDALQFNFLSWAPNIIWLNVTFGPSLVGLTKINTVTFSVMKYDLLGKIYNGPDYSLNVANEKLAVSSYPAIFDVDSAQEFEQSKKNVDLIIYDLNTQKQTRITSSRAKKFEPKWTNEMTLEYNDPISEGRLTYRFQ